MMNKALFFDIDGTLVSFQTHRIPASAVEAIARAKEAGCRIFIATGRPRVLINNLEALEQRQLIDGYVTMNGAYCFADGQTLYKSPIPLADVKTIVEYCAERDIPCIVVGENDVCVCRPDDRVRLIFNEYLKVTAPIPATPPEEVLGSGKEVFQLTPFINEDEEREIAPRITQCEVGRWHPAFADITAKGNTKQRGIDEIIRHFGLRLEDTVAFGDGGNDIPMLRHAAIGIAMGNARDEVKAAANHVTATVDEDGIAKGIEWLFNHPKGF